MQTAENRHTAHTGTQRQAAERNCEPGTDGVSLHCSFLSPRLVLGRRGADFLLASEGSFDGGIAVVPWFKSANQIVLCANCGTRGRQPDGDFDAVAVVSVVPALRIITPRVEVPLDRLSQVARVTLANVEASRATEQSSALPDDVCAGLVAEFVQPRQKFAALVAGGSVGQILHDTPPFCLRSKAASTLGQ